MLRNDGFWDYIIQTNDKIKYEIKNPKKINNILEESSSTSSEKKQQIIKCLKLFCNKFQALNINFSDHIYRYNILENEPNYESDIINYNEYIDQNKKLISDNAIVRVKQEEDKKNMQEYANNASILESLVSSLASLENMTNFDNVNANNLIWTILKDELLLVTKSNKKALIEVVFKYEVDNYEDDNLNSEEISFFFQNTLIQFPYLVEKSTKFFMNYEKKIYQINMKYKKRFEMIENSDSSDEQKKQRFKIIDDIFKNDRNKAFENFQKKYKEILSQIKIICKDKRKQLDNHLKKEEAIDPKSNSTEKFEKYKSNIKKLENFWDNYVTYENYNSQLSKLKGDLHIHIAYKNSIEWQLNSHLKNASFQNKDIFANEEEEIKTKIQFLEANLLINKKMENISAAIEKFKSANKSVMENKIKIKEEKEYKNITASKKYFSNQYIIKEKKRILNLDIFDKTEDNSVNSAKNGKNWNNKVAQQLLLNDKRKKLFANFVLDAKMSDYKFDDNIGAINNSRTKKSGLWSRWNNFKINTQWFFKTVLPWNAIKSIYNKIKQQFKPYIFLERDVERLLSLQEELAIKIDNIKLKYATKMVNGPGWKIWKLNKTDAYYLNKVNKEIEDAIHLFKLQVQPIIKYYELWVDKNIVNYSKNGRAWKKIEKFEEELKNEKLTKTFLNEKELSKKIEEKGLKIKEQPEKIRDLAKEADFLSKDAEVAIIKQKLRLSN